MKTRPTLPTAVIEDVARSAAKHLDVQLRRSQILAGEMMLGNTIVELPTGEGKTLATVLPATAFARRGRRVWIATANDYLSKRDATWMRPIYDELGIKVACVTTQSSPAEREQAYRADIVYGTIREFGFDHLRTAMAQRETVNQNRSGGFSGDVLIVDEADSLLIDEARTPLVISMPLESVDVSSECCFRWACGASRESRIGGDFVVLKDTGEIALTDHGRRKLLLHPMPPTMGSLSTTEILHAVERAILADRTLVRDVHYIVENERIVLVDEFTGRKSVGRTLAGGLHQAIEAREGLAMTPISRTVARITTPGFVAKFSHVCGLTATAWEDRREFDSAYNLSVQVVAPELPSCGERMADRFFATAKQKWDSVADETRQMIDGGRAVLIGTRSIEKSESLSDRFRQLGISHELLTARNLAAEAEVIAGAGKSGRVTIATNLAGRGTDIRLAPEVIDAGGLHVIVSEPHASGRIDRQLIGRGARGGDPGSARVYASAEDEILSQAFGHERAARIRVRSLAALANERATSRFIGAQIRIAQERVAKLHREQRRRMALEESRLGDAMVGLGLDPHLDPLPVS